MQELKGRLAKIAEVVPAHSEIVYFDYPVYLNVGDMLIMAGTERFFKDYNLKVTARYSYNDYTRFKHKPPRIPEGRILVCQGGGNFGDLYSKHQELRTFLVEHYPNHRIVILPQTIFFRDKARERETFALYRRHRDLHLFVRDEASYQTARQYLDHVYLCPDMAHQLYPLAGTAKPVKSTLYMLRTDRERTPEGEIRPEPGQDVLDWHTLLTPFDKRLVRLHSLLHRNVFLNRLGLHPLLQKSYYRVADRVIRKAIHRFSQYNEIVTSRLHGHILSCLLDKPNRLLDNSYGKNSRYAGLWTSGQFMQKGVE